MASGPLLGGAAGVGFGVFQTLNRRAVGGMSDAYLATFLQLVVALVVLAVATVATTDVGLLAEATAVGIALLGLTLGMLAAVAAYALLVLLRGRPEAGGIGSRAALGFKLVAGVMVGLSVWARWVSLDSTAVGVVLALGLLSVPIVLVFSPLLMGRHVERVTAQLWLGGALVVAGGLVLIAA